MYVHTRECVFTCLCIAPIAPLKNVPRGSVLAKWEPRTEAWYELAERKEVRKTKACLDCKQNQDRGRWTEAMPTHRVSTYRMCWAVPNNRFSVHSLDIYNILLHYMQNNSLTPRGHLTSNPWTPAVSASFALTCAVTQHWFDFTFFVIVTLNLSLPRERSSRRLTHAQLIPER